MSLEQQLRDWDGEAVVVRHDRPTGAWIFIALHDRTLGNAMGGTRLRSYPAAADALRDAQRLAAGMTYKWAGAELPFGGGKAVLAVPGPLAPAQREGLLLRYAELIDALGGSFGTGVDMGTTMADMGVIGRRTRWVAGRAPEEGGAGDPGPWTALGVFEGMRAACARAFDSDDLDGRSVLVQGVGDVGAPLVRLLAEAGARLLVADPDAEKARSAADATGADIVPADGATEAQCDVFAPCAIGATLNPETIPRLRCRVVAGSANNQLASAEDADRLAARGIVYVPDFVINAGGAIHHAGLEFLGWDLTRVETRVRGLAATVGRILDDALSAGRTPLAQAELHARRVLADARADTRADSPADASTPGPPRVSA